MRYDHESDEAMDALGRCRWRETVLRVLLLLVRVVMFVNGTIIAALERAITNIQKH